MKVLQSGYLAFRRSIVGNKLWRKKAYKAVFNEVKDPFLIAYCSKWIFAPGFPVERGESELSNGTKNPDGQLCFEKLIVRPTVSTDRNDIKFGTLSFSCMSTLSCFKFWNLATLAVGVAILVFITVTVRYRFPRVLKIKIEHPDSGGQQGDPRARLPLPQDLQERSEWLRRRRHCLRRQRVSYLVSFSSPNLSPSSTFDFRPWVWVRGVGFHAEKASDCSIRGRSRLVANRGDQPS